MPALADRGQYVASESTFYRVLRKEGQVKHREPSRTPTNRHRPAAYVATGPNQVWSWDITYLRSPVRGQFYYLYMIVDVWSRKIVGWAIHEAESDIHASRLMYAAAGHECIRHSQLVLHADNGGPMKGSTLLATLQSLGVASSFSRPRVSNDNPYSESLFRTAKYRPEYPQEGFASVAAACAWAVQFVDWYNTKHRHSGVRFVTPEERHSGREATILARRHVIYTKARSRTPARWSGKTRNWSPVEEVHLNPQLAQATSEVV